MRQTSFAVPAVRPIAAAIFRQLAPPGTAGSEQTKVAAIDLYDAGVVTHEEAWTLGGFSSKRDWNGTARRHRGERKRRAS